MEEEKIVLDVNTIDKSNLGDLLDKFHGMTNPPDNIFLSKEDLLETLGDVLTEIKAVENGEKDIEDMEYYKNESLEGSKTKWDMKENFKSFVHDSLLNVYKVLKDLTRFDPIQDLIDIIQFHIDKLERELEQEKDLGSRMQEIIDTKGESIKNYADLTKEEMFKAVELNPENIIYCKPDPEIQIYAIKQKPEVFELIESPEFAVKRVAVQENPYFINSITETHEYAEALKRDVIKLDASLILEIKNPSKELQEFSVTTALKQGFSETELQPILNHSPDISEEVTRKVSEKIYETIETTIVETAEMTRTRGL